MVWSHSEDGDEVISLNVRKLHILTWLSALENFVGHEIQIALTDGNVIEKTALNTV